MYDLTPGQIRELVTIVKDITVRDTLIQLGLLKPYMSMQEAYTNYGRKQVDRWLREKLINKIKDGTNSSRYRISRIELEKVAATSNRMSWYKHYVPEEE